MAVAILAAACVTEPEAAHPLRVYRNPYEDVDWSQGPRLITQLHDHVGNDTTRLRAYDRAGYDAVSLLSYSGVPSLTYTSRERLWPPERVLSESFRASLSSLAILLPGAEEVGFQHLTSPFLSTYIEKYEDGNLTPLTYSSTQEAIELVNSLEGMAVLAHPWGPTDAYSGLLGLRGMEIYSAFAAVKAREGDLAPLNGNARPNETMVSNWDRMLMDDPTVVGIAVNDHYGPFSTYVSPEDPLRDSGKIIVFAADRTPEGLHAALARGAVVAIRDWGDVKGTYPRIDGILASDTRIQVTTDGRVEWFLDGERHSTGGTFVVPLGPHRYVRAEISDERGSIVYTQAFVLRPVGDVDGDSDVDAIDTVLCAVAPWVEGGGDQTRLRACEAATR